MGSYSRSRDSKAAARREMTGASVATATRSRRRQGGAATGKALAQITASRVAHLLVRVIAERLVVSKGCQINSEQRGFHRWDTQDGWRTGR